MQNEVVKEICKSSMLRIFCVLTIFFQMVAEFRRVVVADLEALECDQSKEVERVKELAQRSRKQNESKMEVLRGRLDVEQEKLEDCHREIEIYRQQLEGATQSLDQV